ncbi:uncharacterized protein LOC129763343 isoform X2 [Toxorhynchites rutilus septentrionalis]|uniref:uncharacterized protein LOC129763343 isoform X2 n=1 Tax=Toxorhynchites rutilus septentrionalis TaxID=329112 RepID=UPI00247A4E35|nr:uncharacterized protein LOC129763343 isoform X2 [Toxorhynchites rutilus septentrionalis]
MQEILKINDKHYMLDVRKTPIGNPGDSNPVVKCSMFDLVHLWCEVIPVENLVDREKLSECVIVPVWRAMLLFYEENCALKELLVKKDIEIEQYKVEGAVLRRSLVATPRFDEQRFADNFSLYAPDEGMKVHELIRNKDRRGNLMKLLKIKHREPPAETSSPSKLSTTSKSISFTSSPTKKSPGGRIKGIEALYAKQRIPKVTATSSVALKRLQPDLSEEDYKETKQQDCDTANDIAREMHDTKGATKVRKITKL